LKRILVLLLVVTLILPALSLLSAPSVKADVSEAKVLSHSWYIAPSSTVQAQYIGDLVAVGEIQNVGSNVLSYVVVSGSAYNSSVTAVASSEGQVFGNNLAPGQKAPFYLDFTPENSVTQDQSWVTSVNNVTIYVVYVADSTQSPYSGLAIPTGGSIGAQGSTGTYTVTGTIQNNGGQTTGNVWAVTTFYDASGTVIAFNYTNYLASSLAPSQPVQFAATPIDNTAQLSSKIANYSVLIQSMPLTSSATPTPPVGTSNTPSSSPTGSTQNTPSPTSNTSTLTNIGIFAIVILLVVIVALLIQRSRRTKSKVQPAPTPTPSPSPEPPSP